MYAVLRRLWNISLFRMYFAAQALQDFTQTNTNPLKPTRIHTEHDIFRLKQRLNRTHVYFVCIAGLTSVEVVFKECLEWSFSVIYRLSRTMAAEMRQAAAPTMHRGSHSALQRLRKSSSSVKLTQYCLHRLLLQHVSQQASLADSPCCLRAGLSVF